MTETFGAAVQYDDWRGEVAADNNFDGTIQEILSDRGLKGDNDVVVGVSLYAGENDFISISAYLVEAIDAEGAKHHLDSHATPVVKKVSVENLTASEFIGVFKRFNISLSWSGMDLVGRELDVDQ